MSADPLLLWQLIDSAFPAGGLSHSAGLEATWQIGEIDSSADVQAFVRTYIVQQGRAMLPFVGEAFDAMQLSDIPTMELIDQACDALLTNHVANRASRSQGKAMLSAVWRVGLGAESLAALEKQVLTGNTTAHFAVMFGAIGAAVGLSREETGMGFLFVSTRAVLSAAVRVGRLGPFEAQTMQHHLRGHILDVARVCSSVGIEDAFSTAPLMELAGAMQDRLYSRLFVS